MRDDLLKNWDARLAIIDSIFSDFQKKYGKVPGIIKMNADDWFGYSFWVVIDAKIFKADSLPKQYGEFDIQICDIYAQREQLKDTIQQLGPAVTSCPEALDFFYVQLKRVDDIIEEYEDKDGLKDT